LIYSLFVFKVISFWDSGRWRYQIFWNGKSRTEPTAKLKLSRTTLLPEILRSF